MTENIVGKIPEFTVDESAEAEPVVEGNEEEVKEAETEEVSEEEKETPTELPAEETPVEESEDQTPDVDTGKLEKQVQGLQAESEKLRREIEFLRGQRREVKQEQLVRIQEKIDDLKDLHPGDVTLIDRVLRSKGYVTKEEQNQMFYDSVKDQELRNFLDKYPEYKPENDPSDLNWSALQRELSYYRMPDNPHAIADVLLRAHRAISKSSDRGAEAVSRRRVEVASSGGGNSQRSSSRVSALNNRYRSELERGGWSEEEIKELEQDLTE